MDNSSTGGRPLCQSGICQDCRQNDQHQRGADGKTEPKSHPLGTLLGAAANLAATMTPLADDG